MNNELIQSEGPVPSFVGDSVQLICERIFDAMRYSHDAIEDLSLPPATKLPRSFGDVIELVKFQFKMVPEESTMPISSTSQIEKTFNEPFVSVSIICYKLSEINEYPEIVLALVLHESTHALRHCMIHRANKVGVPIERLLVATPEKAPCEMKYDHARLSSPPLFMLESPSFHSGYYLEHMLLGGVWVRLMGDFLIDNDQVVSCGPTGSKFRITRRLKRPVKTFALESGAYKQFTPLEGRWQDQEDNVIVFHAGAVLTRRGGDRDCVRF